MKKLIGCACIILSFLPALCFGQAQTYTVAQAQAQSNKSTTGNKEDLLTNYIQVAANNLTSNSQNVTLKLNWFALNFTDSAKKYIDSNYQRTRWQRNGQFTLGGGMDNNSRFNSIQAGVSYNVLNLRDTTEFHYFNYYNKALDRIAAIRKNETKNFIPQVAAELKKTIDELLLDEFQKKEKDKIKFDIYSAIKSFPADGNTIFLIKKCQDALNDEITTGKNVTALTGSDSLAKYAASFMVDAALNKYITSFGKQSISFDAYVDASLIKKMTDVIDQDVKNDNLLQQEYQATSLIDIDQKIENKYKELVSYVGRQPLVTAELNGNYGTGVLVSSIGAGFSGIWGINKLGTKKTNQLTASLSDTLTQNSTDKLRSFNRDLAAAIGGLNTVLVMDKDVSVMELNIGIEDDLLFSQPQAGESRNKFSFNATYRARLSGSPWLKFTIKYDPQTANVLGLLNFTYNLDNSSSKN